VTATETVEALLPCAYVIECEVAGTSPCKGCRARRILLPLARELDEARKKLAAVREHFCVCEEPYQGAQPVGIQRCERCGKCFDRTVRRALEGK